jgi:hypothetical protein
MAVILSEKREMQTRRAKVLVLNGASRANKTFAIFV